jgi:hypothetical protein
MGKTLNLPDDLYSRLEKAARQKGLKNIEQLLESLQIAEDTPLQRRESVNKIDSLRDRLFQRYGQMPDSVDLLREDRAR